MERNIVRECRDEIALKYMEDFSISKLYECSNLSRFGTAYKKDAYVILPESTNTLLSVGRIEKLLCDTDYGYLLYEKNQCEYRSDIDLFMIDGLNHYFVIPIHQLPEPIPLQGYKLGEKKQMSISLRSYLVENDNV